MVIQSTDGTPLRTLKNWQDIHDERKWKCGRSAYEVANFIVHRNGAEKLERRVSQVLGGPVQFDKITAECGVRFDDYGKPRVHDLGIWGATSSGDSLFVGVEAKVNEGFGDPLAQEWQKGQRKRKNGKNTFLPDRILGLCGRFQGISVDSQIRYQLLHAAAGTVDARASVSVFYVVVFVTDRYRSAKGKANYKDYMKFIHRAGGVAPADDADGATSYTLNLAGRQLTTIYDCIREGD